jgi:uncharacterized membrane protein YdjX (TVP38/TMEM64 family)
MSSAAGLGDREPCAAPDGHYPRGRRPYDLGPVLATRTNPIPRPSVSSKLALVVLVVALLALAYRYGVLAWVSDPVRLAQTLVAWGAWGYAAFVLAYTLLQPFGVPGTVFVVAAPLIWPWQVAFVLSLVGTMSASVVGYSFARFVARDWVAARIPERFRRYEAALERNAFGTVVLLRLIFWMPQVLHSFFGVSRVRFWTHFWGSFLGYLPPLFVISYFGAEIIDLNGQLKPRAWPIMGGLLAASLVLVAALKYVERRRRPSHFAR